MTLFAFYNQRLELTKELFLLKLNHKCDSGAELRSVTRQSFALYVCYPPSHLLVAHMHLFKNYVTLKHNLSQMPLRPDMSL